MKHGLIFDLVKLLGCDLLRRGPRRFLQLSVAERHASEPPPRRGVARAAGSNGTEGSAKRPRH